MVSVKGCAGLPRAIMMHVIRMYPAFQGIVAFAGWIKDSTSQGGPCIHPIFAIGIRGGGVEEELRAQRRQGTLAGAPRSPTRMGRWATLLMGTLHANVCLGWSDFDEKTSKSRDAAERAVVREVYHREVKIGHCSGLRHSRIRRAGRARRRGCDGCRGCRCMSQSPVTHLILSNFLWPRLVLLAS
jgi:hypothetical protein